MNYKAKLERWRQRRQDILQLRESGMEFAEIGRRYHRTTERIRQLYAQALKDKRKAELST